MASSLVILDRDGVINHDSDQFIKSADEWQPIDGSVQAIGDLNNAGFTVAVASNQSGLARRLFDRETLSDIHEKMRAAIRSSGGDIDRIVYCPHLPKDGCDCRKPATGLLRELAAYYDVDLGGVPVIGDSLRDIEAALAVKARPILVLTGNGMATAAELTAVGQDIETFADLADAATALIAEKGAT